MAKKISLSSSKSSKGVSQSESALTTGLGSEDFYLPFFYYLAIPRSTTIQSYVSVTLPLPISQSERIWIEFPEGCKGLAGIQLYHGVKQIFPLPEGNWFRSDGYTFSFRFSNLFSIEPYEVEIRGYNLDDTFQHTIWVALELHGLPSELSQNMQSFLQALKG